jgi:hypothetical protein
MAKGFDAVDTEDRDVITIAAEELGIFLDINLFKCIERFNAGLFHLGFHIFAQTAMGLGIKYYPNS